MGFDYTPEQKKVINARNHDVLVSAAAGSGKTAVLVERIVRMISDETNPVDIDRLLIVTFTKAAAAEMRERISLALQKSLEDQPENEHLQKQSILLHNAQITTIDSFCLFVIRNNFNDIGLDPGFRIADEGEVKLLGAEVMEAMLEEYYTMSDPEFLNCVEALSERGDDSSLSAQIMALYRFVLSCAWPKDWLEEALEGNGKWEEFAAYDIRMTLAGCAQIAENALKLTLEADGPYFYGELIEKEADAFRSMAQKEEASIAEMLAFVGGFTFDRLPRGKSSDAYDPEKKDRAKAMRDRYKDALGKLCGRYGKLTEDTAQSDDEMAFRVIRMIVHMTMDYLQRMDKAKRDNNLIDFSDMEHMALQILIDHRKEGDFPSKTAEDYRNYFNEILIDEYQDSNDVQELILKSISGEAIGKYNRFMVGDVKQSIYKFRQARPEIFMDKYRTYKEESSTMEKIILAKNFRSRREVIDSVNDVFRGIMQEDLGGITYDDAAALYLGADYCTNEGNESQLFLIDRDKESSLDKVEQEAEYIAQLIHQLMQEQLVQDKQTGKLRPITYADIAILVRSGQEWTNQGKKILEKQGIPVYTASTTGYFSADEIRSVMNLLRVLDNPLQDIPLFGVLHSALFAYDDFSFSDEELATLRSLGKSEEGEEENETKKPASLYDCLCQYQNEGKLAPKVQKCLLFLHKYRERALYVPVKQLLRDLFRETGYVQYCSALPGGEKRKANLEMLLERASSYESSNSYGLYSFIRYMDQLQTYEVDYGETGTMSESADVVRMMTIHKSKGLEFPVCIVAGLSKKVNTMDEKQRVLFDRDLGIAMEAVDVEKRTRRNTRRRAALIRKMHLEALGEELRVLYVAMTRAKERLIMTALVDDGEKMLAKTMRIADTGKQKVPYLDLASANCFLDFLLPVWKDPKLIKMDQAKAEQMKEQLEGINRKELLYRELEDRGDTQLIQQMKERFFFQYAHENLSKLYTKTTVSELKLKHLEEEQEPLQDLFDTEKKEAYIPRFAKEEETVSGSRRGTAYHRFMELLPFSEIPDDQSVDVLTDFVRKQMSLLAKKGRMDSDSLALISPSKVVRFLQVDLSSRMKKADKKHVLQKERQFMLGIPAKTIDPAFPESERVMIQGVMDMYWEEDGELILADYKTDYVDSEQELVDRYQLQLDYYAQALERIVNKPVKEKILYSFHLGKECRCK